MKLICLVLTYSLVFSFVSCKHNNNTPSTRLISALELKKGQVISCGLTDKQYGKVEFDISCSDKVKQDFNLAVELLHSFEYEEAEKVFSRIIDKEPGCAMAYWGVAMANFHALWTPPSESELEKGLKAVQIAQTLKASKRETEYINAIASFYKDWNKLDHHSRCLLFELEMQKVYNNFPGDIEAAVFYALALDAAADPSDKSFSKQKKAASILSALYPGHPDHPGIVHYLIHTYDYPELAILGLPAARKYASIAPSSAHALHMPSHIFTRLGLWDECIQSNLQSVSSAQCYAETARLKGHWDEELHSLDYLEYAYLQKGANDSAKKLIDNLKTISNVDPVSFKDAYSFAAIPARFVLENRLWKGAAGLQLAPANFPWSDFPWQEAIIHFTRALGSIRIGQLSAADKDLKELSRLYDTLIQLKDNYKANQVAIQMKAIEAWIKLKEGKKNEALVLMQFAAEMENKTEKHPVTPCEVIPAKELLGDMLMELSKPNEALIAYEEDLRKHPNRFNALYGAGLAEDRSGNSSKAISYFQQLLSILANTHSNRPEINKSRQYIKLTALR